MTSLDHCLKVGKVGKAHGIHGQFKLYSASNQPENFLNYNEIILQCADGKLLDLELQDIRLQGKFAVATSSTIADRTQAEALTGCQVWVAEEQLPPLGEEEFYWRDIMGATVQSRQGDKIGILTNIMAVGNREIMVVKNNNEEILIPAQPEFLQKITAAEVIVDLPPGLLEINRQ